MFLHTLNVSTPRAVFEHASVLRSLNFGPVWLKCDFVGPGWSTHHPACRVSLSRGATCRGLLSRGATAFFPQGLALHIRGLWQSAAVDSLLHRYYRKKTKLELRTRQRQGDLLLMESSIKLLQQLTASATPPEHVLPILQSLMSPTGLQGRPYI